MTTEYRTQNAKMLLLVLLLSNMYIENIQYDNYKIILLLQYYTSSIILSRCFFEYEASKHLCENPHMFEESLGILKWFGVHESATISLSIKT